LDHTYRAIAANRFYNVLGCGILVKMIMANSYPRTV